jgi:uncharacterized protein (TIGR04222 family)
VAGHPVSPSEDVDQVWHLHLAYTKSYWQEFCGEILKRPFHHNPTKGGAEESAKFETWYANTLASYRKFFGEEPPKDIWPSVAVHHELKWVDTGSNWIIPKPPVARLFLGASFAGLLCMVGCASLTDLNVFNYRGPEFLAFYLWFSIVVFIGAVILRNAMIKSVRADMVQSDELDPYGIAYLSGGPTLATNAAVMGLIDRKLVALAPGSGEIKATASGPSAQDLPRIERVIYDRCSTSSPSVGQIRDCAAGELEDIRSRLEARGLVFERTRSARIRNVPLAAALLIPAVGLIKIIIGISRDKPVGFLVVGAILSLIPILIYFGRSPFRTGPGNTVLSRLRRENSPLRTTQPSQAYKGRNAIPLAVALFGLAALQQTPYAAMSANLAPPKRQFGDGFASGCGSSCGSSTSSCGGGGSSCGGGGGGCGGCGGSS